MALPQACKESINDALSAAGTDWEETAGRVRAVGVSGQQHGLVALDGDKQVIRPAKLWCDVESAPEAAELSQLWGVTIVPAITGASCTHALAHVPGRCCCPLLPNQQVHGFPLAAAL